MLKPHPLSQKPKTPATYAQRVDLLQQRLCLKHPKCDALLVSDQKDIRYLTGFDSEDSWLLVRGRSKQVHLISDFRFQEQIHRQAPHVAAIMRKTSLSLEIKKLADRFKLQKIGLQQKSITLVQRQTLVKALGSSRLKTVDDGLLAQRSIKDAREITALRKAIGITEQAYRNTLSFIKPGQTEYEIAAYLEYQMRLLGAQGSSFPSIVAVDANSSLPHAIPGKTKVKANSIILIDWGAVADGYCGDLTRVIAMGKMKPKLRRIYQIVLDAHDAAIAQIQAGQKICDIDQIARKLITQAGYGKQFGHSLGHGIGLEVHEQPVLAGSVDQLLQAGQVVTVEPGIYLPGIGGVRIESDVLVTQRGRKVLSTLPTDLASAFV